jgi:hypothetical protein
LYPLAFITLASLLLLAAVAWLFSRLVATRRVFEIDQEWWKSFRPERYAPVLRLLSESEFEYLASLEGCDRQLRAEFRRNRVRLMRQYLREMAEDFNRLQAVGQLMVESGAAGREMREQLFAHKVQFTRALWRIRLQAIGFQFGISRVDAKSLLGSLDGLNAAVRAQSFSAA